MVVNRDSDNAAVRVGVVGAGSWSALAHIPAVLAHPHAELMGLADRDAARLAATAEHYGIAGRYSDHRDLIAAGPDALVVATPHATHYEIARDALDAGIHILVEKPLTIRVEHAHDLGARARAAGLHMVAGYTFNFTSGAAAARAIVRSGELGEITLISCLFATCVEDFLLGRPGDETPYVLGGPSPETYSDPALAGGGQGQTQATHALELVLWVTGLRARRVAAMMTNRSAAVDLIDAISFELENGALGTLAATGALRPGQAQQQELRYYGTDGVLLQDLVSGHLELHPAEGPSRQVVAPTAAASPQEGYPVAAPVGCLVDLIRGVGENLAPAAPAIGTVELLDAAYRSAMDDGRPVAIDRA